VPDEDDTEGLFAFFRDLLLDGLADFFEFQVVIVGTAHMYPFARSFCIA